MKSEIELLREEFRKTYNELMRQREIIDNHSERIKKLEKRKQK